jgi:tetratricopeptide (TPR) repeat protein
MQKLLFVVFILVVLAGASCSGSSSDEANQNANTDSITLVFTDANLALAEGNKFLDEGETQRAINALMQAVKLDPDLAEAWFKLGIAFGLTEISDQTVENTNSETESPDKPKRVKTNSEKAFEKAVTAYKKIIDANPEGDVAYFNLGRAYNKLNEDQDAAKALKQAVKLKPDDTEYQTELGAILIKLAQYHEAIPPLKKALELDPENIRAQELLEDAEAGRRRVNYSATPKEEKKPSNTNTNSNSNATQPPDGKLPPATPDPGPARPRPSPSRSPAI